MTHISRIRSHTWRRHYQFLLTALRFVKIKKRHSELGVSSFSGRVVVSQGLYTLPLHVRAVCYISKQGALTWYPAPNPDSDLIANQEFWAVVTALNVTLRPELNDHCETYG